MAEDDTGPAGWWPPPGAEQPPAGPAQGPEGPDPATAPPGPPAGTWAPGPPLWPAPQPEGLAGAALALALVSFVVPVVPAVIALVLAAQAAGRIRASRGALSGAGLVTAARVVAVAGLILVPGLLVAAGLLIAQRDERTARPAVAGGQVPATTLVSPPTSAPPTTAPPTEPTVRGHRVHITDARVGDCVNLPDRQADEVANVRIVPCRQPHDFEVFALVELPGTAFPGDARLQRLGDAACAHRLQAYTGRTLDELSDDVDFGHLTPDRAGWLAGDHEVTCTLERTTGERLTGSLRRAPA
ncbi:MAG TPA: septum formation family protein [Actinomycetes bacterium]|nr:septum formation family protein [Actinomycetes bacterium]